MCHNRELVLYPDEQPELDDGTLWHFLHKRVGKVTGIVISGGEPTLQPDLATFIERVRNLGYAVKLDTNGYRPDVLHKLLAAGLLDFVAMDIKAPPPKYAHLAGLDDLDIGRIEDSLTLLTDSDVTVEYRTTVVPGLLDADDIEVLAGWLSARCGDTVSYVLQQFRGLHTLDPDLADAEPLSVSVLHEMAARADQHIASVELRGV
jgi:pyruvate formate lyase activating enzyme